MNGRQLSSYIYKVAIIITIIAMTSCSSSKKAATQQSYLGPTIEKVSKHSGSDKGKAIEKEAKKWLGTKYKFGGNTKKGVDCSGLVMEVYRATFGIKLPRNSAEQSRFCKEIKKKDLKKGDLVFFSINSSLVNHVGIYLEDGRFIHASRKGVVISNLNENYYKKHYQTAGRVTQVMGRERNDNTNVTVSKSARIKSKKQTAHKSVSSSLSLDELIEQKLDSIYRE